MKEIIFLVDEAPEGSYTARALGESIFTEADDLDELRDLVGDAVRCHFEEDENVQVGDLVAPSPGSASGALPGQRPRRTRDGP